MQMAYLSSISLEARVIHVVPRQESWMTRPQEKWKSAVTEKKLFKIIERGLYLAENWRTLNIVHACFKKEAGYSEAMNFWHSHKLENNRCQRNDPTRNHRHLDGFLGNNKWVVHGKFDRYKSLAGH